MYRVRWDNIINCCGFSDKSRCFNCSGDILCVVEAFHSEIMQLNRRHWDITIPSAKVIPQSYVSRHMAPSNWSGDSKWREVAPFRQCDLYDEVDNAVFIKYGETAEELNQTFTDLARVLEANDVEKYKIDFILNSVNGSWFIQSKLLKNVFRSNKACHKETGPEGQVLRADKSQSQTCETVEWGLFLWQSNFWLQTDEIKISFGSD